MSRGRRRPFGDAANTTTVMLDAAGDRPRPCRITPARMEDIPALAALKRDVASRTYGVHYDGALLAQWLDEHCGEAHFRYRLSRPSLYKVLVARDAADAPIGVAYLRQRGTRADMGGCYVAAPGEGIGRTLCDDRDRLARDMGCTRARVSVHRTNERARRFVAAQGYQPVPGRGYRDATLGVMVDMYERSL